MNGELRRIASGFCLLLGLALLVGAQAGAAAAGDKTEYYAIEINGVLCGYSENSEARVVEEGRPLIRSQAHVFAMLSLLGSTFNSEIRVDARLDPDTRRIRRAETNIDQGGTILRFSMDVAGGEAVLTSTLRPGTRRIPLTPGLLVGDDQRFARLRQAFLEEGASELTCDSIEVLEEEVQPLTFRRVGAEEIVLANRTFAAQVIEMVNGKTGMKAKYWLAPGHDGILKIEALNRKIFLADRRVVDRIKVANMDAAIFTRSSVAISDVQAITYMKLKVRFEPTGVVLKEGDLDVPGQTFRGTIRDNVVEGELEISHARYDGRRAPPFPPAFPAGGPLARYLKPEPRVESDDPVLAAQAREVTAGSADSWQAAVRLARWVADNISYAIPGGGSARRTYDIRAGECGAHSMLLAALCRAVGIPARVVFGAMYAPNYGGGFGQHAWNEVYMGEAGWIPVDSTAFETDFLDSGHIRVSELHSATSSTFNGRRIDVLDYRLAPGSAGTKAASSRARLLGKYTAVHGGRSVAVVEKEGNLSLDVPGRVVLPFADADAGGRWVCKYAPHLYLVFREDGMDGVKEMELHQVLQMPRKESPEPPAAGQPPEFAPLVGTYTLAATQTDYTVQVRDGKLAIYDPREKSAIFLLPPAADGGRADEEHRNTYYFVSDAGGAVTAMKVDAVDRFVPGEPAAEIVEREIQAQGLEAGLKKYAELKRGGEAMVRFDEASFNRLGYRLLAAGKLAEAVAVFELNVRDHPDSFNAHDSLGEGYRKSGRHDRAVLHYRKSLELNPKNENAARALAELEKK